MPRAERVHRLVGVGEAAARLGLGQVDVDGAALEPQRAQQRTAGRGEPGAERADVVPGGDARGLLDLLERRRQPAQRRRPPAAPARRSARCRRRVNGSGSAIGAARLELGHEAQRLVLVGGRRARSAPAAPPSCARGWPGRRSPCAREREQPRRSPARRATRAPTGAPSPAWRSCRSRSARGGALRIPVRRSTSRRLRPRAVRAARRTPPSVSSGARAGHAPIIAPAPDGERSIRSAR